MKHTAGKSFIPLMVALILVFLLAGSYVFSAVAGVQVVDAGFQDNLRHIIVTNNNSETVTIYVQGSATLTDNTTETASTTSFSIDPGHSVDALIPYTGVVATVHDDLDPIGS